MAKLTVRDLDVRGKRVFMRVDYNVPMEEKDGQMVVTDNTRIVETLPTLTACQRNDFQGRAAREMNLPPCAPNQRLIPQHAVARGDLPMPAEPLGSRRVEEHEQLNACACAYQAARHLEGYESPE